MRKGQYRKTSVRQVEDAARRYHSAGDAASALGITPTAFRRLCNRYDIQWRKGRKWEGSKKYQDTCANEGCSAYPSSRGLCFRCYAEGSR